ncbi:DUF3014 domain-containing protein [Caldimonas manganoxidans]|uniref:DUF3014 domain-containing protein n=1 Tax=Caldimonas manganoxidans TaxID=196015 RepID=UPI0003630778|nr:DUF3014 domain-containing protein [Caldimonas manganoxidans]
MPSKATTVIISVLVTLFLAAAAWLVWERQMRPAASEAAVASPASQVRPSEAPAPPVEAAPTLQHPVDRLAVAASADADAHDRSGETVLKALNRLLGRQAVQRFLLTDDFVRRVVATTDQLARPQAPSRLWPVAPAPGRFQVESRQGRTVIAAANADRYEPFVRFIESIDLTAAAALYVRHYGRFQAAYEELGYPGRYFNDRMVAVVDHLLDCPEPTEPVAVRLPEVQGPVQPARPWVMYEYEDARLQTLSAGHKLMLRLGPDQRQRLKERLAEWRRLITTRDPGRQ